MKSVLIDVHDDNVRIVDTPESLQGFYDLIKCETIEVRHIMVGPKEVLAVVDEEGLLVENPKVSMMDINGQPGLVGNLLVCQEDGEDIVGLTNSELTAVCRDIHHISYIFGGKPMSNVMLKGVVL